MATLALTLLTFARQLLGKCTYKANYPDKLWLLLAMVKNQKVPAQWTLLRKYLYMYLLFPDVIVTLKTKTHFTMPTQAMLQGHQ